MGIEQRYNKEFKKFLAESGGNDYRLNGVLRNTLMWKETKLLL